MPRKWIWSVVLIGGQCVALSGCTQFRPWEGLKNPFAKAGSNASMQSGKPTPEEGKLAMARLCERRGDLKQAERFYQELLAENPNQQRVYHRLGVIAAQQGRYAQADENFHRAMTTGEPNVELLCDAGYSLYLQHRLQDAEATLRQALAIQPQDPRACNNLGLVLGEQGRLDESLAMFKRAGKEADAYTNLGYVLAQIGDLQGAQQMYSHALTLDGSNRPAAEAMLQVAARQKKIHEMMLARKPEAAPATPASHVVPAAAHTTQPEMVRHAVPPVNQRSADVNGVAEIERRGMSQSSEAAGGVDLARHDATMLRTMKGGAPNEAAMPHAANQPSMTPAHPMPLASAQSALDTLGKSVTYQPLQTPQMRQESGKRDSSVYAPTPWPAPTQSGEQAPANKQPAPPELLKTSFEAPTQAEPWPAAQAQGAGVQAGKRVEVSDRPQPQTVPTSSEQSPFAWFNALRNK